LIGKEQEEWANEDVHQPQHKRDSNGNRQVSSVRRFDEVEAGDERIGDQQCDGFDERAIEIAATTTQSLPVQTALQPAQAGLAWLLRRLLVARCPLSSTRKCTRRATLPVACTGLPIQSRD
jgi:hypothetical protein